ncbi:hypothetical protein pb186bvf_010726 [Paramecium bursaria]
MLDKKINSPPKIFSSSESDFKKQIIVYMRKHASLDGVTSEHTNVQSYVEQVDPKGLAMIELEEKRLQQKYSHLLNQLDRTRLMVQKLEEKLKQQNDLENNPQIIEFVSELQKVDKYKEALIEKTKQLQQALHSNKNTISELKRQVYQKRLEVREIVQDSWKYQTEIISLNNMKRDVNSLSAKSLRAQKKQVQSVDIQSAFLTQNPIRYEKIKVLPPIPLKSQFKYHLMFMVRNAKSPQQQQSVQEILDIYKQVQSVKNQAFQTREEITQLSNKFNQIRNLFLECAQMSVKHFKSRQKITNQNGYANSIYLDVNTLSQATLTPINKSLIGESSIIQRPERNIKNILYDTLQHIMIDMIDSHQRNDSNGSTIADSIIRNSVSLEQFTQFTSDQILGLLVLQPRLLQEVIGIFDIKQKQLGLLNGKLRVIQQQIE